MTLRIEVLSSIAACAAMRETWSGLVTDDPATLNGMDATAMFEWSEAVMRSLAKEHALHLVCCYQKSEVVGLLPVAINSSHRGHSALRAPTDFYGGRSGLLLRSADANVLAALLRGIGSFAPHWKSYSLVVLQGGKSDQVLMQLPLVSGFRVRRGGLLESPAFPILANEEDFRREMSKNLYQALKKSRNRCNAAGGFEVKTFNTETSSPELLRYVLQIDGQSWKESSGTSITASTSQTEFYSHALPTLARAGVLFAAVLFYKGQPAAYNFGLCREGVYCCLKLSYVQDLEHYSPGRTITAALVELLRERGVQTYDFMGKPDPYKLQWSRSSWRYTRYPARVFNHSLAGRGNYFMERLRGQLRSESK